MAIRIRVPPPLRPLADGRREVEIAGASVGEALQNLESLHQGFLANILDNGQVRRFVTLYVNGNDIRFLAGLETPVRDGDTISIIPAIAGAAGGS